MDAEWSGHNNGDILELSQPLLGSRFVEVIYNGQILRGGINVKNPFKEVSWATIIPQDNPILRKLSPEQAKELKRKKMEVKSIPYDVWYELNRIRDDYNKSERFVGYHSKFFDALVECGFIELEQADDRYNFYTATPLFGHTRDAQILEKLCGKPIKSIMAGKVISVDSIPDDFEDMIEALEETDGYFDKVDLCDSKLGGILRFHGYTTGAGANGHYHAGTEKLKHTNIEKIIEDITGLDATAFEQAKENSVKRNEIKLMKELADKYEYIVLTESEYDNILLGGN